MAKDTNQENSRVDVGDIDGSIKDSAIAGRDVHLHINKAVGKRSVAAEQIIESVVITGDGNKVTVQRLDLNDAHNLRNHHNMRQLVKSNWIDGVLKHSLYNEVLIHLDLEKRPDTVDNPFRNLILQQPRQADNSLPSDTRIRPNGRVAALRYSL